MKTLYAACLARLGLSQAEAAAIHTNRDGQPVRLDTVKSWCAGRNPVPPNAWADLRRLEAEIVDRSEAMREAWEDSGEMRDIEISLHGSDRVLMAVADFLLSCEEQVSIELVDKLRLPKS